MFYAPVPTLVIRADTLCLAMVNGRIVGECSRAAHVSIPVSDTGDYYVCVAPLEGEWRAVTRKLSFEAGALACPPAPDVSVCVWPGGVFELMLFTGAYVEEEPPEEDTPPELALACAFAEAVRDGREEDAAACLEPELADALVFEDIREFFGEFAYPRAPFSDRSGKTLGLVSFPEGSVCAARIFEFDFGGNRISNVKEA
ncbi:MAG TPA: hypothetical protein VN540_10395 [Clostridia bacterium]|nr:hypothetical protein [Clostridia bacterium]